MLYVLMLLAFTCLIAFGITLIGTTLGLIPAQQGCALMAAIVITGYWCSAQVNDLERC